MADNELTERTLPVHISATQSRQTLRMRRNQQSDLQKLNGLESTLYEERSINRLPRVWRDELLESSATRREKSIDVSFNSISCSVRELCYDPIRNPVRFETGRPASKLASRLRNGPVGFTTVQR